MRFVRFFLMLLVVSIEAMVCAQTPGTLRYPTNLDTTVSLFETANRTTSTLNGGIGAADTSLILASGTTFPNSGAITIDSEIIFYTGKSTNTLTGLIRGGCLTSAASHTNGAAVRGNIISCHQQVLRDAIIAVETKLGSGSSTPAANTVLQATGAGSAAWNPLTGTAQTSFNIGSGTPKAGNTMQLFFSNDANRPGFRWNGSTNKMQFSDDGTNWFDVSSASTGIFGSGTAGRIPKFTGSTALGNSLMTESGSEISVAGFLRATSRLAVGSSSTTSQASIPVNFSETYTDPTQSYRGIQNLHSLAFASGSVLEQFAFLNQLALTGTQNYGNTNYGGRSIMRHEGSGIATDMIGVEGRGEKTSTGAVTKLIGTKGFINTSGSGVITDARAIDSSGILTGGAVTSYAGVYVDVPSSAVTITDYYGVRVTSPPTATNQWVFYSDCTSCKSRLGFVDIGTGGSTFIQKVGSASTTWDPPSVANSANTSTTVTISQAAIGDSCIAGFSNAVPAGAILSCNITALATATVTLFNFTGGALDLASGTLRATFLRMGN